MLSAIPSGTTVMVDATILAYHFGAHPMFGAGCANLWRRIATGDITGWTTTALLAEMIHKLMVSEAVTRLGAPERGALNHLRRHPDTVKQLLLHKTAVEAVANSQMRVVPVTMDVLLDACDIAIAHGLLTTDAVILATMRHLGLTDLATNDDDFDGITGITVWKPR
jgi:predicted nucleic acid-binding protein